MSDSKKIKAPTGLDALHLKYLTETLRQSETTVDFVRHARDLTSYIRINRPDDGLVIQVAHQANEMARERHGSMPRVPQTAASRRALGRVIAKNNSIIHALRSGGLHP